MRLIQSMRCAIESLRGGAASSKRRGARRAGVARMNRAIHRTLEPMEQRLMLTANVVINEFVADNSTGLKDYYGQRSDWIELHNLNATPQDLTGWHLTDTQADPLKWTFPTGTTLAANGYMVVFATNRDIKAPNGELHTNFKLDAGGEYLGLVQPDGVTIASQYAPVYPQQYTDVSYGLSTQTATTTVLGVGSAGKWLVPTSAGALNANWAGTGFNDSSWTTGTVGLGFDSTSTNAGRMAVLESHGSSALTNIQDAINLILGGTGTITKYAATTINFTDPQSAATGHFTGNTSFGGNTSGSDDNFAIRVHGTIKITTAGQYTFGVNSDDGFSLQIAGATFSSLTGCTNTSGTDTMQYANTRSAADSFGTTTLAVGNYEFEFYYFDNTSTAGVEFFSATGAKTAFDSSFKRVGDTAGGGLGLIRVADTLATNSTFSAAAQGVNASAFLRIPFTIADASSVLGLNLRMKYDDGFVAYLNGQEVARVNAPTTTAWNSASTADQLTGDAVRSQLIDLTLDKGFLIGGANVLAIQGLNNSAADTNMLILPQLDVISTAPPDASSRYFVTPTPGAANSAGSSDLGPIVTDVSAPVTQPGDADAIVVTARVRASLSPLSGSPSLFYRVNYNAEASVAMYDDGAAGGHGDATAGDGIWTGTIPASASTAGQMVRWYVKATDTQSRVGRWPIIVPVTGNDAGPEYVGTVIADPSVSSTLPIFQWFTQDTAGANGTGARASVFYLGQFYDNVFVRHRGGNSTVGNKFKFNSGYDFQYATDRERVTEFNLNSQGLLDDAYIRPVIGFETFENAGVAAETAFPMRIQLNGTYSKVALFVEQMDDRLLERYGLYGDGSLYKLVVDTPTMNDPNAFEKDNRDDETSRSDLSAFLAGIHLTGTAQTHFLFDNLNIPAMLDYIAANVLTGDEDDAQKNYFLYRDTNDGTNAVYQNSNPDGTNEWTMLPWDKDLTFGVNFGMTDYAAVDPQTHPFFADHNHPKNDGPQAWNWLIDALLTNTTTRQMFLRRLRTVMDEQLQPVGTPVKDRAYESRLDELFAELSGDTQIASSLGNLTAAFSDLKTKYLDPRRVHLYVDHSLNTNYPDYAGIPAQQNGSPTINFGSYDASPGSGNQDEEYLTLVNPNSVAVDISGWRLGGGVDYTFKKGTVIPAGGTLFVSPNVYAFRNRPGRSSTAIEFVQGNYSGHLSRLGESVTLSDAAGKAISNLTTPNAPSAAQSGLRITEIMYHPQAPAAGSPYTTEDFAYIELKNVGNTTLSLAGVKFTDGIYFDFTGSAVTSVDPGGFVLVVANTAAFTSRYGHGMDGLIAGTFAAAPGQTSPSGLNNAGEHVRLADAQGETILAFDYNDTWYTQTDGIGNSLVIRDPSAATSAWDSKTGWSSSAAANGSPGADETPVVSANSVVINEVMSNTTLDAHGQWIELRNLTGAAIDVSGWYLSNDAADLKKYQIAAGTMIAAGGYLTFNQVSNFGSGAADAGKLKTLTLLATGNSLYLTSASGGALGEYQTSETFSASAPEVTQGRYITSTGEKDFVPMAAATYGATNAAPRNGPVVINEVMYHPAAGYDEFIELKNTTGAAVSLANWKLTEGIDFTFPAGATIAANGYALVVKTSPSFFRTKYSIPAAVTIYGSYDNALGNDGDTVELKSPGTPPAGGGDTPYYRVDQVQYSDSTPWPVSADGFKGSLNRISATAYGDDVANWQAGHSTPGAALAAYDATAPSVPGNVQSQVINATQTNLSWAAASDAQSGVSFYYVYANGNRIAASATTTFSDIWVSGTPRSYQVSAVNADGVESFLSGTVLAASITGVSPDPRLSAVTQITIVFNSPVSGFDLNDLTLTRDGGANLLTGSQTLTTTDNITWTLGNLSGLTATAGSYLLTLTASGSGIISTISGGALAGNSTETWTLDQTPPTVSVVPVAPDPRVTIVDQITITFSEAVTLFDLSDLTLTRSGSGNLLTASQTLSSNDGITWTLGNLGGLTYLAGSYQLSVIAGAGVTDLAGNSLASGANDAWTMSVTAQSPFDTTDDGLGTVTAQGQNGTGEGMLKAFDNLTSTKWLDFANANTSTRASWIQYQYVSGKKYVVTQYTITSANDSPERDPGSWQLLGSNDGGATWVTLDSRSGETFASRFLKKTYSFTNAVAYNVYRLNILSVATPGSANAVQLAEIELIGLPPLPPPTVAQATYDANVGRQISFQFSQSVKASLSIADIVVHNSTTNQDVTPSGMTYDDASNTATFTFSDLPDGNYTATLSGTAISDAAGSPLDGNGDGTGGDDYPMSFFALAGDANHDRTVDFNDLVALAQNYNTSGKTFAGGDFNYDGTVDFNDLVLLAQRYNTTLAAPAAAVPSAAVPAAAPVEVSAGQVLVASKPETTASTASVNPPVTTPATKAPVVAKPAPIAPVAKTVAISKPPVKAPVSQPKKASPPVPTRPPVIAPVRTAAKPVFSVVPVSKKSVLK